MKVQELRIGNWVKDGYDFEQIEIDHLVCLSSGRCEFDPIPLTEEWLLKFGFEKLQKGLMYDRMYLINTYLGFMYKNDLINDFVRIDYVHQLQNLFFALTGEELKVKL